MGNRNFLCLTLIIALVTVISGYSLRELRSKIRLPTAEDCLNPPHRRSAQECCRLPKERIWGDLRASLNKCIAQKRMEQKEMRQKVDNDETEMVTSMSPEEFDATEASGEPLSTHRSYVSRRRGKPHSRKRYLLHRRQNDACFVECLFEDQGFLSANRVNKEALLIRFNQTLGRNEMWYDVAVEAVETCLRQDVLKVPSNSTCQSGSEEVFRCVFKEIFLNCPSWLENSQYCSLLKEFYNKCPNGPSPETQDNHTTPFSVEEVEGSEGSPTTDQAQE